MRVDNRGQSVAFRSERVALACERREFSESLRRHAAATYPGRILFRYGWLAFGADLDGGVVTLQEQETGETVAAKFDLLIGADGENSRVRGFLEDQVRPPPPHISTHLPIERMCCPRCLLSSIPGKSRKMNPWYATASYIGLESRSVHGH